MCELTVDGKTCGSTSNCAKQVCVCVEGGGGQYMYLCDQFVHNQLEATRVLDRNVDGEMSYYTYIRLRGQHLLKNVGK